MTIPRCAVLPDSGNGASRLAQAVRDAGGEVVGLTAAQALIWTDPSDPAGLEAALATNPSLRWVQLPFAGIEPLADVLDHDRLWTSGKGVYAEPVAEHALGLALAGLRHVGGYAREQEWSAPVGRNLLGATVTILGGGEITRSLLRLLHPFDVHVTVVRRHPDPLPGAAAVVPTNGLLDPLSRSDVVVLALALTPETTGIIGRAELEAMPEHAWLVNVARGRHVDTDALVEALQAGTIGGAALDVTDPEPLPAGHPLWKLDNCIITPHIGNTPEMGVRLLVGRVHDNVRRFAAGEDLLGAVDVDLGY